MSVPRASFGRAPGRSHLLVVLRNMRASAGPPCGWALGCSHLLVVLPRGYVGRAVCPLLRAAHGGD